MSEYRPHSILGPACWPHFDLLVVLRGSFLFDLPRADLKAIAGDALVVPKGVRFRCQSRSFGGTIWIHHFIPGKAPDEEWIHHLPRTDITHYEEGAHGSWAQALLDRIHEIHSLTKCKPEQIALFKMLLNQIRKTSSALRSTVIQDAIKAAREQQWRGVDLVWMAKQTGWSQSHFRAKFLAETGETAGDFLTKRRLDWAQEMLRTTDIPIKQISREAGYGETSAFHHAFRRVTGCPPAQYRRDHPKVV